MLKAKRNVLSVALATAIIASAGQVYAQSAAGVTAEQQAAIDAEAKAKAERDAAAAAAATTLDVVEVTGIRASIEASIDTKREETSIVEAISSEDIGKLPDTSIADALARLPGLTAQRFGNRPQEVNIRGFAGDFSTALLNGREQVSLGNNRGVEFDQYPAELINQVVVYKTPDGSLVGQGLAATVDLRTVRPLDFDDRIIALNVRGDQNELDGEKKDGYRASISYIDQFNEDTVGFALGYATMKNPVQGRTFGSWGYDPDDGGPVTGAISGSDLFEIDGSNERDGLMAVFEYKPNEDFHSTLDFFYSQFQREENKDGFQFSLQTWTGAALNGRTNSDDGTAIDASYGNVGFGVIRGDFNGSDDSLFAVGWNTEFRLTDNWSMDVDLSHSSAHREERVLETYARLRPGISTTVDATFNPDGYYEFDWGIDLTDPNNFRLMDPGGWGGDRAQAGYLKDFEVDDELNALRVDFERTFEDGMFSALEFGGNITDREKSRASSEWTLCLTVGCTNNAGAVIPEQALSGTTEAFGGLPFITLDQQWLLQNAYYLLGKDHVDIRNKNWEVQETVTTLYGQLNIDTDLGSVPVRGNFGVQGVRAEQESTGIATFNGVALDEEAAYGLTTTDWLPSLNLSFQFPYDQFLRVAGARQMARPRMDDLRSNASYSYNNIQRTFSGDGGNPLLEPWLANAYDISYEKYFQGNRGYVSFAYFYKDLSSYIYRDLNSNFDFSNLPIPEEELPNTPVSYIGNFTQPQNGTGGVVKGWEFAVSVPFDLFWAPLEGFGFQGNYSDTDSDVAADGPGSSTPLPGLSKYVSNMTLYYERYGFSARVSQRHRSRFLGEIQGFGGDRVRQDFGGETVTDVQVGYAFPEGGTFEGVSLLLQVANLENEPFQTQTSGFDDRPTKYEEYGRTFLFGVSYRF